MIKGCRFSLLLILVMMSACTTKIVNYSACGKVNFYSKTAVVPFTNNTETPLAGERAMSITAAVLESKGIYNLAVYKNEQQGRVLFPGMNQIQSEKKLMDWARSHHARYILTGSVNEWTYKVGLDGEPVVGISMQVIDLSSGQIVWTAVGSQSGYSGTAVSTVGQKLINQLIGGAFCGGNKHEAY